MRVGRDSRLGGALSASILLLSAVTLAAGSVTPSSAHGSVAMAAAESVAAPTLPPRERAVGLVEPADRQPVAFRSPKPAVAAPAGAPAAAAAPLSAVLVGALGIPELVLQAYRSAEAQLATSTPGCHLRTLADEGRTDLLTLGVTPVLAAQLDDPYSLDGMHHWLGNWQLRAAEAAGSRDPDRRALGHREHRRSAAALHEFETRWRHGGAPRLRELADSGAVELLGGPSMHPFQPLLDPRLRTFALREGRADAVRRWGRGTEGIWAPECAFTAGMELDYAAAGVGHFMVDGPALHGDTTCGRPVGDTHVVAFGRDLPVSYRVWSPKSGYPGHSAYRDFHTYDHDTGLKPSRVTGRSVAGPDKAPYEPERAAAAVRSHVEDFVDAVRRRLRSEHARTGSPALVVAAFDTELFGHWWHEGPAWLAGILRALPEAGIRVGTLAGAKRDGYVGDPVDLPDTSWGSGKDWRVWAGDPVRDLVDLNAEVTATALDAVDAAPPGGLRDRVADQILRETMLTVSSDWAFMVSKDSAAQYARDRAHKHAHAVREIADARVHGHHARAADLASGWNQADDLFPDLDARRLQPTGREVRA